MLSWASDGRAVDYFLGISAALVGTLFTAALTTDNPTSIPWVRVWPRAAFGLAFSFIVWFCFAAVACLSLDRTVEWLGSHGAATRTTVGVAVGLTVPQLRLAQRLVRQSWYRHRISSVLAGLLVWLSETTRIYPDKIIAREERKIGDKILTAGLASIVAVDKLYEFHLVGIILRLSTSLPGGRAKAARLSLVRNPAIKVKSLMRHLGAVGCVQAVSVAANDPSAILPGWPSAMRDRRNSHDRRAETTGQQIERRKLPFGRRRMDHPAAAAVLGLDLDHRSVRRTSRL